MVDLSKKMDTVVAPAVAELKERAALRSDLDKVAGQITKLESKLVNAAAQSDPKVAELAREVAELRTLVEAMRKQVDSATRDVTKDLKTLQLEVQKVRQTP
jgi:predicted  nucleic acid-binding Zn-ribbon protein